MQWADHEACPAGLVADRWSHRWAFGKKGYYTMSAPIEPEPGMHPEVAALRDRRRVCLDGYMIALVKDRSTGEAVAAAFDRDEPVTVAMVKSAYRAMRVVYPWAE